MIERVDVFPRGELKPEPFFWIPPAPRKGRPSIHTEGVDPAFILDDSAGKLVTIPKRQLPEFLSWLQKIFASKRGRFIRITFRTNPPFVLTLAPPDALPQGYALRANRAGERTFELRRPDWRALVAEFRESLPG